MNRADRAKQFLPFDALNGLRESIALVDDELSKRERLEVCEETAQLISDTLAKLTKGMKVEVTFYNDGHYYTIVDTVIYKEPVYRYLKFGSTKVFYDDIYSLNIIANN